MAAKEAIPGLGGRLAQLRAEHGLTQAEFGARVHASVRTVRRWEADEVAPEASALRQLAHEFAADLNALLGEQRRAAKQRSNEGRQDHQKREKTSGDMWRPANLDTLQMRVQESLPHPPTQALVQNQPQGQPSGTRLAPRLLLTTHAENREYQVIPNITERVCAGLNAARDVVGGDAAQQDAIGVLAIDAAFMRRWLGRDDDQFATVTVEGDSMSPALANGEMIVIDTQVRRINVSGIYVLRFEGELTVKRVIRRSDGSVLITSDNPSYAKADETFTRDAAAVLQVAGRMVWPRVR